MGKQRNKDRAYISASEWATEWGGHRDRGELPYSRLPFHCCAITFAPFGACVYDAWRVSAPQRARATAPRRARATARVMQVHELMRGDGSQRTRCAQTKATCLT